MICVKQGQVICQWFPEAVARAVKAAAGLGTGKVSLLLAHRAPEGINDMIVWMWNLNFSRIKMPDGEPWLHQGLCVWPWSCSTSQASLSSPLKIAHSLPSWVVRRPDMVIIMEYLLTCVRHCPKRLTSFINSLKCREFGNLLLLFSPFS